MVGGAGLKEANDIGAGFADVSSREFSRLLTGARANGRDDGGVLLACHVPFVEPEQLDPNEVLELVVDLEKQLGEVLVAAGVRDDAMDLEAEPHLLDQVFHRPAFLSGHRLALTDGARNRFLSSDPIRSAASWAA